MKKVDKSAMYYTPSPSNPVNLASANCSNYLASPTGVNENHMYPSLPLATATSRWTHNVPQQMPWAVNGAMRFTAQSFGGSPPSGHSLAHPFLPMVPGSRPIELASPDPCTSKTATQWELFHELSSGAVTNHCNSRLKRRNSSDEEDDLEQLQPPAKVYIDEEKVATRFKSLNIGEDRRPEIRQEEEEEDLFEDLPQMHFSNEVKQVLGAKDAVEKLFLSELEKPSKAIVVWKPPVIGIEPFLESCHSQTPDDKSSDESEVLKPDNNVNVNNNVEFNEVLEEDLNDMMDL